MLPTVVPPRALSGGVASTQMNKTRKSQSYQGILSWAAEPDELRGCQQLHHELDQAVLNTARILSAAPGIDKKATNLELKRTAPPINACTTSVRVNLLNTIYKTMRLKYGLIHWIRGEEHKTLYNYGLIFDLGTTVNKQDFPHKFVL